MRLKIDIVELLSRKELIAGLEISDDFLRLVSLDRAKNSKGGKAVFVRAVAEEALRAGIVVNGALNDEAAFIESLKNLVTNSGIKIKNFIISIPDINIYSKIFSFPKAIAGEKLAEAMRVTAGFNLPNSSNSVYLDWETVPAKDHNELYLATVPKEIIDPYIKAFASLKFNIIAAEHHILSLIRAIKPENDLATLYIFRFKNATEFVIAEGRAVRFIHFVKKELNDTETKKEVKRVSSFYETDNAEVNKVVEAEGLALPEKFGTDPRMKDGGRSWLVALGTAMRALLPRSEDTLVSLMPIGTEAAYETQKQAAFARFVSDMTIGIVSVISVAFIAVWVLMMTIQANTINQANSSAPLPQDAVASENRAIQFNALVAALTGIVNQTPKWSVLFDNFLAAIPAGIVINNFSSTNPTDSISIAGIAKTRADLNNFRRILEESTTFTNASFPLSNLEKRTDIPFTASMRLRDPNLLINRVANSRTNGQ